ncbi:MAG TPA: SDR family NAD(P)-dependent oxidoreductase [Cyclobacteriaceae bacterium]|nr:SDR family NAD(P)-dependent oxidoreductase [Cyclobacteriaceae bacterium]
MSKTIIITGASGNLGKATVEKLIAEGYTLVVTVAPGLKLGFHEDHPQIDIQYVDMMDEPGVEGMVNEVIKKYGTVDAALLIVGGYAGGTIKDTSGSAIQKMIDLNFNTAYHIARPVFNHLIEKNQGRIIFIGARPAIRASEGKNNLAYALSKSLIFKLSEFLNAEAKDTNVVTSVIVPSTMDTPANRKYNPNADFSKWVKPGDVAELMAYLISEKGAALREPVLKMYGGS